MSVALAREGVRHRIVGDRRLAQTCTTLHLEEVGRDYVNDNARVVAASVDTLVNLDPKTAWLHQIELWIQDEAHHVLADNKWGRACALFPNAKGLGVTATPTRADGKGLGRHADGLMDAMVVGPSMRELIGRNYLTDYDVAAPTSTLDLSAVPVTDSGDYSPMKLKAARRKSTITGDVVKHYLRWAKGKRGVTFDTDIESATETAAAFRAAGVPAQVVTSKTPDALREKIKRQFKAGEVLQLVNVDLFGEGYDLPAIEVVSMARPTQSYSLYCQQFGRALRILEGKTRALIIDHVGNVERHGLPDAKREWTLDRRERRARGNNLGVLALRTCTNAECVLVYERFLPQCPYCGTAPEVADRSSPEKVDGDLTLLDPAVLARLRGEINRVDDLPRFPSNAGVEVIGHIKKHHRERQQAQLSLRKEIALWAGWQNLLGYSDREVARRFFLSFGIDTATVQTLGAADATALTERVRSQLSSNNVMPVGG
jgi:superfamily II DNA or RNA helicase